MVEKRTLVFLTLAMLVWAVSISSLAGYFYLQNATHIQQIGENQRSLNKTASNYDESMSKYNTLLSEYSMLYYSYSPDANFTLLMEPFGRLMNSLKSNYSSLLMNQEDLNETYYTLEENYQLIYQEGNVTEKDFGRLLDEYYDLFNLLAIRELGIVVSETVTLTVNISVYYGNETVEWYNETVVPAGSSLFQLTKEIAIVDPKYDQWAKPGHIFIEAINDKEGYSSDHIDEGYSDGYSWMWYYWDSDQQKWVSGPVGCDAWMLKDGGIYKWSFEYWRFDWPWS